MSRHGLPVPLINMTMLGAQVGKSAMVPRYVTDVWQPAYELTVGLFPSLTHLPHLSCMCMCQMSLIDGYR